MATDTITVPGGVGPVKREYVMVGGAVAAGAAFMLWHRRGAAAAAVPDPSAAAGDMAAGVDAYANPAPATVGGNTTIDPETMPPTSNAAWAERAVGKLSEVGWDAQLVTAALGRYLNRQPLANVAEREIVQSATAMVGPPPVGEFSIITEAPAPVGGTTPAAPAAAITTAPAGLKASSVGRTSVHLSYHSVGGATSYQITQTPGSAISTTSISHNIGGLKPKTRYSFTVAAVGPGGPGPASGPVTITTKK